MRVCPLIFIGIVTFGCATTGPQKSERTVLVDGQQVSVEDLAAKDYRRAEQMRIDGELAKAEAALNEILNRYDDASAANLAKVSVAKIMLDTKRAKEAEAILEKLLLDHPKSEAADDARYTLALAQLAQGDAEAAAPTLKNLVDKLPTTTEKREAAIKLADELYAKNQGGEAARYLYRAYQYSEGEQKAELEERLIALIDSGVRFNDLRRLKETEAEKGSLLDEILTFKLARVYLHLKDNARAQETVAFYLDQYPQGRFSKDATSLNNMLNERLRVDARALGVVLPLSGKYASYGKRALAALKLGLGMSLTSRDGMGEVVASKGSGDLKLIVKDSGGDAQKAAMLMRELVEQDHVIGVIGELTIDAALPVAMAAEELGVPSISLSRRDGLAEIGEHSFVMAFTPKKQARALASVAMDGLGMKRFGILYPQHAYGLDLMHAFWDEVDKRKGEITAIEKYNHDQTTFTTEAKKLVGRHDLSSRGGFAGCRAKANALSGPARKAAFSQCRDGVSPIVDFDALLIPDDYRTVSYILPALEAEDILITSDAYRIGAYRKATRYGHIRPIKILLGSLGSPKELSKRLASRQADGTLMVHGYNARSEEGRNTRFVSAFKRLFKSAPSMIDAHAYDTGALLAAYMGGDAGEVPKTREALKGMLSATKEFPGVTGLVTFDEQGDSATVPVFFKLSKGGVGIAGKRDLQKPGDG